MYLSDIDKTYLKQFKITFNIPKKYYFYQNYTMLYFIPFYFEDRKHTTNFYSETGSTSAM